jgi:hypothetical protein
MTRVSLRRHADERPIPPTSDVVKGAIGDLFERLAAEMDRTAPSTPRPPLPLGAPARSIAAMAGIRAEAPALDLRVANGTLSMRRPPRSCEPRPANPFAWQTASAACVHTLAVVYDDIADELEMALAELAELAPFTAKAVAP